MENQSHIASFFMKRLYPVNYIATFGSGANKPILVRAIGENGDRMDVVVKLMDSERMDSFAALKELIGALFALELGLKNTNTFFG